MSFAGIAIVAASLSAAGSASMSDAGASTAAGTMSIVGLATASFASASVLTGTLSASGNSSTAIVGAGVLTGVLSISGEATATFVKVLDQVVSTRMIQNPVDYTLAGDQRDGRKGLRGNSRIIRRHIFDE